MSIPIYNCIIEEKDSVTGIYAISFVDYPANEVDFVALSKNAPVFLDKNSQKQILTGVVLRPEQLIYRFSENEGGYYIKFSAEEIEKIAQKMMKMGIALNCTTHQHDKLLSGNYLTELWIVKDSDLDKSKALGFENLPSGTLMCSYKIEDSAYWRNEVMTGNVKGFSLEGFFNQKVSLSKINNKSKNENMKKKKFKFSALQRGVMLASGVTRATLSEIEAVEADDTTDSGDTFREFTLLDGKIVLVDADGFATMDGEQMQAGEHSLADGNILVIDENGDFVETKEPSSDNTNPEEATASQALRKTKHELAKLKAKQKKQKLSEETVDSDDVQTLKDKIKELETLIAELKGTVEDAEKVANEAVAEATELKKRTPSAKPAVQKQDLSAKPFETLKAHERIALSLTLNKNQ